MFVYKTLFKLSTFTRINIYIHFSHNKTSTFYLLVHSSLSLRRPEGKVSIAAFFFSLCPQEGVRQKKWLITSTLWEFDLQEATGTRIDQTKYAYTPLTETSRQIIIFHQPGFPWNKGISLTEPPFGVRSCEVAIIWPETWWKGQVFRLEL